jgi:hypothetical protein
MSKSGTTRELAVSWVYRFTTIQLRTLKGVTRDILRLSKKLKCLILKITQISDYFICNTLHNEVLTYLKVIHKYKPHF